MLGGVDVTNQLQGGQIGANITLRDTTMPTDQAELDEFSQNLAARFSAQGLTLFTDPRANVPTRRAATAGAKRLRGVRRHHPGQSGGTADAVTGARRQPSGQPPAPTQCAGFSDVINARAEHHASAIDAGGSATNTGGLGPAGTLSAPYSQPSDTGWQLAATMTAAQAQDSASTSSQLEHRAGGADHAQRQAVVAERCRTWIPRCRT